MEDLDGRYVFIPESKHGSGHFIRCARLAKQLGGCIYVLPGFIRHYFDFKLTEENEAHTQARIHGAVKKILQVALPNVRFVWKRAQLKDIHIEKLIFDVMDLSAADVLNWQAAMKIGLDVVGEGRKYLDYTIDMLHTGPSDANTADSSFLFLPSARRQSWPTRINRVLLIFGSRDRTKKSVVLQKVLSQHFSNIHFYSALKEVPDGKAGWNTAEYLHHYDLVITHYGVTMYEALWARVPVLLINPTRYHQRLTHKKALRGLYWNQEREGFETIITIFDKLLRELSHVVHQCQRAAPPESKSLPDLLESLIFPEFEVQAPVHTRLVHQSIIRQKTGMFQVKRFTPNEIQYDKDYFNKEYKEQYGKNYIEDFEHIYELGKQRLSIIQRYTPTGSLLDVGCAYGHFLKVALDSGFHAQGIEISEDAVRYAKETAKLEVVQFDIERNDLSKVVQAEQFDVITMWYVLEHFHSPLQVLQSILPYLRYGGVFAFSSPSTAGISARKNIKQFFHDSPADHHAHFNPWFLRRIFTNLPLKLVSWRSTGHHPERIHPTLSRHQEVKILASIISKAMRLGDTFEAYFVKS